MMIGTYLGSCAGAPSRSLRLPSLEFNHVLLVTQEPQASVIGSNRPRNGGRALKAANSDGGDSYLGMWKKAVDNERKNLEFQRIVEGSSGTENGGDEKPSFEELERKSQEFQKILEVPKEERDRIQRVQVIDRAAAAIAAARAVLQETDASNMESESDASVGGESRTDAGEEMRENQEGNSSRCLLYWNLCH